MSKKEGEILKQFLRQRGMGIGEFATKVDFSSRSAVYYQFDKEYLDQEFKEKAAKAFGVEVSEIFGHQQDTERNDSEKVALRKLVSAQEEIIGNFRQFVVAQLIRLEALETVNAERIAALQLYVGQIVISSGKELTVSEKRLNQMLDQYKLDVKDKIELIKKDLKLP